MAGEATEAGSSTTGLLTEPRGRFLHVLDGAPREVWTYRIGNENGAPTLTDRARTRNSPAGMALMRASDTVPGTRPVLVTNDLTSSLRAFSFDDTSNRRRPPVSTAGTPVALIDALESLELQLSGQLFTVGLDQKFVPPLAAGANALAADRDFP